MKGYEKYERSYFLPPECTYDWVKKDYIDKAPLWCSVDLRDGNQALIEPMSLEEKLDFFKMLVDIGFKEIEVGFPAASETEFNFTRALIERDMIPDDVTIHVLTQAREHIIKKTFKALEGAPRAVVHLYNSTSVAQREQVFKKSKEEIKQLAVDGAILLRDLAAETDGNFRFQYSPESFSGTEVDYAVDVCNAVLDVWQPKADNKAIINIPTTVENAMPHVFATQIEYINKHLKYRDGVVLCLHPHNDRGCGVATSELGVLAGAEEIEGTLFGNGERTGNVDIVTLAMNLYSHGVDPQLDFSNLPEIREKYETFTRMKVGERQPYAGDLVFSAFSGSHQDAISKGMAWREEKKLDKWTVPYLPIDPKDVGRTYEADVIRINSQSGKGGVAYILKQSFGINVPQQMREQVGYMVKQVSDEEHKELSPEWVHSIFTDNYVDFHPYFTIPECHFKQVNGIFAEAVILHNDSTRKVDANGNGRLDAVSNDGRYRDDMRSFLKGDDGMAGNAITRITGSRDLYSPESRGHKASVNFMTCHDGFTLYDLYSYNEKHNEKNGWNNTDGDNNGHSWNCGAEGETDDPNVNGLRRRLIKNAFAALLCSRGPAMFFAGDEFCNTQFGNNNAYCQDNIISWLDWSRLEEFKEIHDFVRHMIQFRKEHPILRKMTKPSSCQFPEISVHNGTPFNASTDYKTKLIGIMYAGRNEEDTEDDIVFYCMNAYWEPLVMQLPVLPNGKHWHVDTNTNAEYFDGEDFTAKTELLGVNTIRVPARTTIILVAE